MPADRAPTLTGLRRALLRQPVITLAADPHLYRDIAGRHDQLARWFRERLGWPLVHDTTDGVIRLRITPAHTRHGRIVHARPAHPTMTRLGWTTAMLVCAALAESDRADVFATDLRETVTGHATGDDRLPDLNFVDDHTHRLALIVAAARHLTALPELAADGPLGRYGNLLRDRYGPRPPSAEDIPDPSDDDLPTPINHHQAAANDQVMADRWGTVRWRRSNASARQSEWEDYHRADPAVHVPLISSDGMLHTVGCDHIGLDATPAGTLLEHAESRRIHSGCVGAARGLAVEHLAKFRWAQRTLRHIQLLMEPGPPSAAALQEAADPTRAMFRQALARKATETIDRDEAEWVAGILLDLDTLARDDTAGPWESAIAEAMRDRLVDSLDADPDRLVSHAVDTVGPPPATLLQRMRRQLRGYDATPAAHTVLARVAATQPAGPRQGTHHRWSDHLGRLAQDVPNVWLLACVAHDRAAALARLAQRIRSAH